jgi:hypothetical protein
MFLATPIRISIAVVVLKAILLKDNHKTKDNQNNKDQRGHVEAQSPLAVSPGSLQVSSHLHVPCLRQREKKRKMNE